MMDPTKHFSTRTTPQSEPIPGSAQVPNSAGGYSFAVNAWTKLDRFLLLGTEGGSFYATEHELTIDNAQNVLALVRAAGVDVVRRVVELSAAHRIFRKNAALFTLALAIAHGNDQTKRAVREAVPEVCTIATDLMMFAKYAKAFRGWGPALKKAVAGWYTSIPVDRLAHQLVKYRNREGWTHHDLMHVSHPRGVLGTFRNQLFGFAKTGDLVGSGGTRRIEPGELEACNLIAGYLAANAPGATEKDVIRAITDHGLTWEMVPTEFRSAAVWEALIPHMPMTALVRNLGNMGKAGLLVPMSRAAVSIAKRLNDADEIRKSRIHPLRILTALVTYRTGQGARGSGSWLVVPQVVDALDAAFYSAFGNVEPANKRTMLALDISASMNCPSQVTGTTCRELTAAFAMVTARVEPAYMIAGFCTQFTPLTISPRQRMDDVVEYLDRLHMGGTDCAQPMLWALENKCEIDTFVVYTDDETWAGRIHPVQALRKYREQTGIPAKLVVVSMVANEFSIADPSDAGMLDVIGCDTMTPEAISTFSRG